MFDLQRLRALHAVRAHGSVAAAATALGFTPSAVSQQIGKLEREVGAALLERAGRGVFLTDAGLVLAEATDDILSRTEEARARLEALREGLVGSVRIASFATAIRGVVAPALGELRVAAPGLSVTIEQLGPVAAVESVEAGHADLAVTHDWADTPVAFPAGLHVEPLAHDPVDVLLPAGHPLASRPALRMAEIAGEVWATDVGDGVCTRWLRTQLARHADSPRTDFRTEEYDAQIALVAAGVCLAAVPRLGRGDLPPGVVALPVAGDRPYRRLFALSRVSSSRRPAIRTITGSMRRHAAAPGPVGSGGGGTGEEAGALVGG